MLPNLTSHGMESIKPGLATLLNPVSQNSGLAAIVPKVQRIASDNIVKPDGGQGNNFLTMLLKCLF